MRSEAIFAILALLLLASGMFSMRPPFMQSLEQPRSPGGFPKQSFDSSRDQTPWEVPEEIKYPNWTQFFPDNNRIYTVGDSVEIVADWYTEKLPGAVREDKNGKRHVVIRNKDYEVDIERGGDLTKIAITPLSTKAGPSL